MAPSPDHSSLTGTNESKVIKLSQDFNSLKFEEFNHQHMIALRKGIQHNLKMKSKLTLKMQQRGYDFYRFNPDPDILVQESIGYLSDIQSTIANMDDGDASPYEEFLSEAIIMMIYTSNWIENAGADYAITRLYCQKIFGGDGQLNDKDEDFDANSEEYQATREYLLSESKNSDHEAILRSRRQIIQHALAVEYITERTVIKGEDLSEDIIKNTHKILTHQIDAENEQRDKSETYGGCYRSARVVNTFVEFLRPDEIKKRMGIAVSDFNKELKSAEASGTLDFYAFAAKWHHVFHNIHPFLDGNSRLCRLVMNTILLKSLGIVIPIGRDHIEAAKWKETTTRANELESLERDGDEKPAYAEMNTLVAIQGHSMLELLKDILKGKQTANMIRRSIESYYWEIEDDKDLVFDGQ